MRASPPIAPHGAEQDTYLMLQLLRQPKHDIRSRIIYTACPTNGDSRTAILWEQRHVVA
jgi:hypothetical protein